MQPITLYVDGYYTNQWDGTCIAALVEKQLPYSTARALLRDGAGVPIALRERTGIARVPALQHGDLWLTESSAIVEYLEDTFPPPEHARLLPAEPRKRAHARQLMSWLRVELAPLREDRPWWTSVYPVAVRALSPAAEHNASELIALALRLVTTGALDDWTIASADLAFTLMRIANSHPIPAPVRGFLDATLARPSLRAYLDLGRPPNPPPQAWGRG
jgi:glutathione S-transferase